MKVSEITPEWIKTRARTKGLKLYELAKLIPLERTAFSKSLNGKRNFLGWELLKLAEILGETPPFAVGNPELTGVMEDYLALSEADRLRARVFLRALLQAEALEGRPEAPGEPKR